MNLEPASDAEKDKIEKEIAEEKDDTEALHKAREWDEWKDGKEISLEMIKNLRHFHSRVLFLCIQCSLLTAK